MTCTGRINVAATQIFGSLTIGGVLMHRLAFAVTDVTDLWLGPDVRGEDLMIPGRPGRIAFPRRADVTERQLPMVIDGRFDVSGNEFAGNEFEGLLQNIEYLRANVVDPTGVGDGTRAISLTRPGGGSPLTGTAHILNLENGGKKGSLWAAMLTLSFPDGSL